MGNCIEHTKNFGVFKGFFRKVGFKTFVVVCGSKQAAVETYAFELNVRRRKILSEIRCKRGVCKYAGVYRQAECTCGIAHCENIAQIKAVLFRVALHPREHGVRVFQRSGKAVFRGKAVCEIHHGKTALSQIHAVELIDLLAAVDPAAAVNAHNNGELFTLGRLRAVNIEYLPLFVRTVWDIVKACDILRRCEPLVALSIGF